MITLTHWYPDAQQLEKLLKLVTRDEETRVQVEKQLIDAKALQDKVVRPSPHTQCCVSQL